MKKLIQIASLFLVLALVFTSCAKEKPIVVETPETAELTSKAASNLEYDIETEDGLVKFENLEEFTDALTFLSDSEKRFFTDEAFLKWEEKEGFRSLRSLYSEIWSEIEKIESENDFIELQQRYSNFLFDEVGPILPVNGLVLASVLNEKGNVIIDDALHHFTNEYQIIIFDKSSEKLELAKSTLVTDEAKGIYVLNLFDNTAAERGACGTIRSNSIQQGSDNSNGSRRLTGVWRISRFASATRNANGGIDNWKHTIDFNGSMESRRRHCCWWVDNTIDDLSWGVGWGVTSSEYGDMAHGTGWNTENTSHINFFFRCFPVVTTPGGVLPGCTFSFTYNGNHLTNTSLSPDLVCEDDCF